MEIINLTKNHPKTYFEDIARIHRSELIQGALQLLGLPFLSRLYLEITDIPETGAWVAVDKDKVVGFITGALNIKKSFRILILRSGIILLVLSLREILKPVVLKKIIDILKYPLTTKGSEFYITISSQQINKPELLSIAVDKLFHGQGIGKRLVHEFEANLISWGFHGKYFVSTDSANFGSNAFYKRLDFTPCGLEKVNNLIFQKYYKEI